MARTSATISVGADTRQLERDIQRALGRDFKFKGLNEKAFTQPLGRITGAANEFQKSLDASNARVIAFGASAGLIYTVERAFSALVKSTIDVQKSLTDINVILNVSNKTLENFGGQLFSIAKNTAQSFDTVAQAATEFSRQGLGLEETLKRTRDALILTRLSGLDTVSAVEALTATINSFSDAALDSTTIINKLANVDAAFAVSSADLAEAIKRVGSSAQDAGVGFDELLAIVTSVQQTTARGGAVIGNSLKTIFTRIQRTDTLDQLQELGIQVRDLEGGTLPAIQILNNLSTTFDKLSDAQRAQLAETVGGVFQINILKAALGDLGKQYSVYSRALETAGNATDEAITRNEALNQTLSALINKTFVNLTKLGSDVGKISFQPTFESALNLFNKGLESLSTDSEGIGGKIGKGIFQGLGAFISGPGVILITAVFGKLLLNLAKFSSESLKTLLNVNTQAEQRAQIQARINQVLSQEPALVQAVYNKQISVLDVENKILNIIRQQTLERERAAALSTTIAGGLLGKGVTTKGGTLKAKSGGFIPNFAMSEIFGALAGGYSPGNIRRMNIPGEGPITYNSAEKVKRFPGLSQPAIMPPSQSSAGKNYKDAFGSIYGFNPYAAEGFIPNFSVTSLISQTIKGNISQQKALTQLKTEQDKAKYLQGVKNAKMVEKLPEAIYNASSLGVVGVAGSRGPFTVSTEFRKLGYPNDPRSVTFAGIQGRTLDDLASSSIRNEQQFSTRINALFANPLYNLASEIFGKVNPDPKFLNLLQNSTRKNINLFPKGTEGSIFEAAVNLGVKKGTGALEQAFNQDTAQKPFDFEEASAPSQQFNTGFAFDPFVIKADAKRIVSSDSAREIISKAYNAGLPGLPRPITKKLASQGFIPNFTALSESIDRELSAGVSPSRIRIGRDKRLTSAYNPLGLGVYNTQDEPLGLGQGVSRYGSRAKNAGAASGFIPSFANIPTVQPVGGLGMIKDEMALSRAVAQTSKNVKLIETTTDKLGKNLEGLNNKFLTLSIGLPILINTISQFVQDSPQLRGATTLLNNLTSFGFAGQALGGAKGGKIGLGIGTVLSIYQIIKDLGNEDLKTQLREFENLRQEISDTGNGLQQLLPQLEEYRKIQFSDLDEISKTQALEQLKENILNTLQKIPEESTAKILQAFESGELDKIPILLNESLFKKSAELIERETKLYFDTLYQRGIKSGDEPAIAKGLLRGQSPTTGRGFVSSFIEAEGGRERTQNIINNLDNIAKNRDAVLQEAVLAIRENLPLSQKPAGLKTLSEAEPTWADLERDIGLMTKDFTGGLKSGGVNFLLNRGLSPENAAKTYIETNNTLDDVLNQVKGIYYATEEGKKYFDGITFKIKDQSLTLDQENAIIKEIRTDLQKRLGLSKQINKKQELIIRNLEDFENYYAQDIITESLIRDFGLRLDKSKEFAPERMMGREYGKLFQGIRTEVINQADRAILSDQLIIGEKKLKEQVDKRIITEDQYILALQALQESSITLNKRQRGLLFAEDFRTSRQSTREKNILSNQTKLTDFSDAFFDEFDYRTEDAFRDAQLGAKETARTIKSEFNNAFFDFAQGTATAGQAFEKFALNISNKIQQLALEFSTNLLFGKLFGSTSNIFGLGGGSGGGGFGSLFGFKKGGIIKGYSSGGNVTGGSGTKDDVPAMLSQGEYVIRKSAVKKYGSEYLQMLNEGKVQKKFSGTLIKEMLSGQAFGALTGSMLGMSEARAGTPKDVALAKYSGLGLSATYNGQPASSIQQKTFNSTFLPVFSSFYDQTAAQLAAARSVSSTSSTSSMARSISRPDEEEFFKYGGRVKKFARGGEASFIKDNYFTSNFDAITIPETGQTLYRPKEGQPITEGLNIRAILDSSNPQNEARKRAEDYYIDRINQIDAYLEYVEGVRRSNEEAYAENQRINQEIRDQYNKQKSQAEKGAWLSFLLGAGAAGSTFLASGGQVKKFAKGGSNQDNIPALLMDGEFVMRKEAVNLYGKKFFDDLNTGRVKKFANGGPTSNERTEGIISDNNYNSVNNVNITVNMSNNQNTSTSETGGTSNEEQNQKLKLLSSQIKDQVIRTLVSEQRPGGILSSTYYSKR